MCVSRNELRSLYLQPPKVLQTFGASLILIFIEYENKAKSTKKAVLSKNYVRFYRNRIFP
ncbi:hypothetical protein E8L09_04160 [Streptococcus suis]|uniref:Uncharacterized protein n=1 Tax=Streptococcus suis TaxID=1307 RepID=A0A4T2GYC3_STRSU|nr:hypothetical protein E8L09_04160 [Streptococcus suis]